MNTLPQPNLLLTTCAAQSYAAADNAPRSVTSETLLGGARELVIKHAGRDYHLRLTKLGKLILTA